MTNLEKMEANEQREAIFARDNWTCRICGKPIRLGQAQLAHRIASTKNNIAKYGNDVIFHSQNMWSVCSLDCNSHANIGNNPMACAYLVEEIHDAMNKEE
jgi:5-methylcytosine-specific restriction endonuclease McrA